MLKTQLKVRVWARTQFQSKYAARVLGRGTKRRATTTVACLGANTKGTWEVIPVQNRPVPTQPKTRADANKTMGLFWGFYYRLLWVSFVNFNSGFSLGQLKVYFGFTTGLCTEVWSRPLKFLLSYNITACNLHCLYIQNTLVGFAFSGLLLIGIYSELTLCLF